MGGTQSGLNYPYKSGYAGVPSPAPKIFPNTVLTSGGHTHWLIEPMGGFLPAEQRAQIVRIGQSTKFYQSLSPGGHY